MLSWKCFENPNIHLQEDLYVKFHYIDQTVHMDS